jgi:hypothetical protein
MAGSGNAAMATRLTDAAATAPPASPANLKKSLLDVMLVFLGINGRQRQRRMRVRRL